VSTAIVLCATLPVATASRIFLTERSVLGSELAALPAAFAALPPHERLVIPPSMMPSLCATGSHGDPVEAFFPLEAYAEAMRARGLPPAETVTLDRFLAGRPPEMGTTLVYLGATLSCFTRSEIQAGCVPQDRVQPLLHALRDSFDLAPVATFTIPSAQNPYYDARLAADQTVRVTLGFFAARKRDSRAP